MSDEDLLLLGECRALGKLIRQRLAPIRPNGRMKPDGEPESSPSTRHLIEAHAHVGS